MIDVEDRFTGNKIGTVVRIPHISVADDMCFITEDRSEVQPMLSTAETYANRELYTILTTKTVTLQYNQVEECPVTLYGK